MILLLVGLKLTSFDVNSRITKTENKVTTRMSGLQFRSGAVDSTMDYPTPTDADIVDIPKGDSANASSDYDLKVFPHRRDNPSEHSV